MKVVAFVPIKLNSSRVPHKNILEVGGRPLCYHIMDTLLKVNHIDEVYVYCSDSKIKNYIPEGIKYLKRDEKLDQDLVKGEDIYKAFINEIDADIYILAHTTSPFTKVESIQNALNQVMFEGYDSSFSAQKIQTFTWYKGSPLNYSFTDVVRTQDIEPVLVETSGFYMFKKEIFSEHARRIGFNPYIQIVNNLEAIDIDEVEDFEFAKLVGNSIK